MNSTANVGSSTAHHGSPECTITGAAHTHASDIQHSTAFNVRLAQRSSRIPEQRISKQCARHVNSRSTQAILIGKPSESNSNNRPASQALHLFRLTAWSAVEPAVVASLLLSSRRKVPSFPPAWQPTSTLSHRIWSARGVCGSTSTLYSAVHGSCVVRNMLVSTRWKNCLLS